MGTFETAVKEHRAGNASRAKQLYRRVVEKQPAHAEAWYCLGVLALTEASWAEAAKHFAASIRHNGANPAAHSNLGEALRRLGRGTEAVIALRAAVALRPELPELRFNLGLALEAARDPGAAVVEYEAVLAEKPSLVDKAGPALLSALRSSGRTEDVIARWAEWGEGAPRSPDALCTVANALADRYRLDDAVTFFERALALSPAHGAAEAGLGVALLDRGDIDDALRHLRRAALLGFEAAHHDLVFAASFHPDARAEGLREEGARWCREKAASVPRIAEHANVRDPERRLRVGYVSGDFRNHVAMRFFLPLLAHHDRERFDVRCYGAHAASDDWTARVRELSTFRDVASLDDGALARLIADDRVDVLVDLSMHTAHNRLLVFARKPAPVQLSWLAYPGSTGLDAIDARLTDPWFDPEDTAESIGPEIPCRLDSFWCWDPMGEGPDVGELPALSAGHVTFGCLNNFRKVSRLALSLWASALHRVPRSRLLLVAPEGHARERVRRELEALGVSPERVEFAGHAPRGDYLSLFHRVDVSLDPLPVNGGATSLESFWMGVPVLSPLGETIAGRAGRSIAMNLGLPELSVSPEGFAGAAAALTFDLPRLAELRRTLRDRLRASTLMDAPRFTAQIERAYRALFRAWCG